MRSYCSTPHRFFFFFFFLFFLLLCPLVYTTRNAMSGSRSTALLMTLLIDCLGFIHQGSLLRAAS